MKLRAITSRPSASGAGRFPRGDQDAETRVGRQAPTTRAHGLLGALLRATGDKALAARHLTEVAVCDPDDAYGYTTSGRLAYEDTG